MANNQVPKVLIFSTAYFPLVGGAEVAVREITDRIKGFEFDMITAKIKPDLADQEKIGKVNVYRVGSGSNFDKYRLPFLGLKKAIQLEKENQYKLTWSIMASFGGFLGLRFKKKYLDKPWLLTLQEGDPPEEIEKKVGILKLWFRQIFKRADYIQAISHFLLDWARKMGAKSPGEVIPNGVDIEKFKRADDQVIKELKEELGIKNEKVILTVSRLVKKNGVDDLIKVGQYLDFSFKILIEGSGEQEKELKDLTEKLNLKDKVMFLGHIDYNDLPKYYSAADVFVRTARSEGFGNVFLEALACGTPIIGTAPGGSALSILSGAKAGLLCGDIEDIARKIDMALKNDMSEYVENGQKLIREEYTWDSISSKMEKIFLKII